jgi:hypothetical protein
VRLGSSLIVGARRWGEPFGGGTETLRQGAAGDVEPVAVGAAAREELWLLEPPQAATAKAIRTTAETRRSARTAG